MERQGDLRARSVKAEFDEAWSATAQGGAVLAEKAMRRLGVRRLIEEHLPARAAEAQYSTGEGVYALLAGLLVGGQGLQAAECLREDALLGRIFGCEEAAPSVSTMYRVLCDLAGLDERKQADCYEAAGPTLDAMDMWGGARRERQLRRVVPEEPEAATAESQKALETFGAAVAKKCARALRRHWLRLHGWYVVFGDATDLEVDGRCFDAARMGRDGQKILRWQTVKLGPIVVAQHLGEGNRDEGRSMPALLEVARQRVGEIVGASARVLVLLDAAYFERQVVDELPWDFIVSANQQRDCLTRLAAERLDWRDSGADRRRGWAASQTCCFTHRPDGWQAPVTIVARRWREEDDLPEVWRYSFLATRIEPTDLPEALVKQHGYCALIWMLYGTKQGRENHYKTFLRDCGLHHPPSGRLGVDQAFYTLAVAAGNIAMVLRYEAVPEPDRGLELWRLRQRYFQIAGRVVQTARTLTVYLTGAGIGNQRQTLWRDAFAAVGRL